LLFNNEDGSILPKSIDENFKCGVQRTFSASQDLSQFNLVNGKTDYLRQFPFAVLLVYYKGAILESESDFLNFMKCLFSSDPSSVSSILCIGTLINRRYVLTAAHYITSQGPREAILGDHDLSSKCDCDGPYCVPLPQKVFRKSHLN